MAEQPPACVCCGEQGVVRTEHWDGRGFWWLCLDCTERVLQAVALLDDASDWPEDGDD